MITDVFLVHCLPATTRKVYKRKLTKLLSEGGAPSPSSVETSSANSVKLKHDNSTLILSEFSDNDGTFYDAHLNTDPSCKTGVALVARPIFTLAWRQARRTGSVDCVNGGKTPERTHQAKT